MHTIRSARTLLILGLPLSALLAVSQPNARVETVEPVESAPPPAAPSASAPADAGIARAQQYIAEREYHASANAQGLQAPNRRQNLRSYFDGTGVRVHDRTAPGAPQLVSLSLAGVGRGETLREAPPGEVVHDGTRVEIRRPGLVEWYVNQEAGLEQGFTLETRSAGDGPLVLELAIDGATARAQGEDVVFATGAGRKLSFAKLAAKDAAGRELAARFEVASAQRLRYVVDDAGAKYPVVIDPLLSGAPDATIDTLQDYLGPVAAAGDVNGDGFTDVIVGAPSYDAGTTDEGAAFIFLGGPSGVGDNDPSTADTQLESNQAGAQLGFAVAGAGDVNGDGYADVIVGAPTYENSGQTDEGAAFVFLGGASGVADGDPSTAATFLESNLGTARFGTVVSGAGDVNGDGYADVLASAPEYDSGSGFGEGAVFIFQGSASGIANGNPVTAATQLEGNQGGARFGRSAAGAGDVDSDGYADVIIGSLLLNGGAAFVFLGDAGGIADGSPSTAATQLQANQANANFGASVASAGDVNGDGYADMIIGAPSYDAGETNEGAAFIFHGSDPVMTLGDPTTAATQIESNYGLAILPNFFPGFAASVGGAGDVNGDGYADVIIGSQTSHFLDELSAYVFLGSGVGVADGGLGTAFATLIGAEDYGGDVVAGVGDVNGDGYADVASGVFFAGVHVYHGGAEGLRDGNPSTAATQLESNQTDGRLGSSVASAGDVNGDGFADVIVGVPRYDNGQTDEGAAFLFHGSETGTLVPSTQLESNQASASFGDSVAGAGDVNGDGYADVIVGASLYTNGEQWEGGAFVFHGTSTGIPTNTAAGAPTRLEANQAIANFGLAVAGAGDVNGDGYADVIVGAPLYDAGEENEGAAFVFHGASTGIPHGGPSTAPTRLESDHTNSPLFGLHVAGAGDVNGDGLADVLVGAPTWKEGEEQEGAAFVFHGVGSGIPNANPSTAATVIESNQAFAFLGKVSGAGDVNADGYADVIVGADFYDAGEVDEGVALVFHGSASGIGSGNPSTADSVLESNKAGSWLGGSVAGIGDVNGDGYADVAVGAGGYDNGETDEGAVFTFHGSATGVASGAAATAPTQLESNQASSFFGNAVAGAGDVNGDGYADLLVGALLYDASETDEGAAFVFLGNGDGDGRPVLARQLRASSNLPIAPWGSAESTFRASMVGTHPAGRGRVKLQLEHCPAGLVFGAVGCTTFTPLAWTNVPVGTAGVTLTRDLAGLPQNQLRHWRARLLYAPSTGATPANPAHGPWRRVGAQAVEADFRTVQNVTPPPPGCGIGPELALLVPALFGLRRLRGRGR